jgi:hypothetical protein
MKSGICVALAALLTGAPLWAHHSAAAEYVAQLTTWKAVITRFSWMNPHTWVYFDTVEPNGRVVHRECEGSSPNGLTGNGWTRTTIKPGDHVVIEGWPAKDRPEGCKVRAVILQDGKKMYMGWVGEVAASESR